jgi:hypothetical protein
MRLLARCALVVVVTVGVSALVTTAAHADNGDGAEACTTGEICLKNHKPNIFPDYWQTRHYWYGDMSHWDDRFGGVNGPVVMDNMSSIWNRDTECVVNLWDITSSGTWYIYLVSWPSQTGGYVYVGDASNDRNNGHSRC